MITRITIETSHSPAEVIERIRMLIGPNVDTGFFNYFDWAGFLNCGYYPTEKHPLHGKLKADGFCLRHIWARSASPYFRGHIRPAPIGSQVEIRITPEPVTLVQLAIVLAISTYPPLLGDGVPLLFVASVALIGFLAYLHHAAKMERMIRDAVSIDKIASDQTHSAETAPCDITPIDQRV